MNLSIRKYAEPNYFQGFLYNDKEVQVMTWFFAAANWTRLDGATHFSFFAHDRDTVMCLDYSTVTMDGALSAAALDLAMRIGKGWEEEDTKKRAEITRSRGDV